MATKEITLDMVGDRARVRIGTVGGKQTTKGTFHSAADARELAVKLAEKNGLSTKDMLDTIPFGVDVHGRQRGQRPDSFKGRGSFRTKRTKRGF